MLVARNINQDIDSVAKKVRSGMVRIESTGRGSGAGTVWHPEGLILTNAHVAISSDLSVIDDEGQRYPARLLASDRSLDLAALSVQFSGFETMQLGSTSLMRPGELVFAMGYPWGVAGGLTAGVYIGLESWGLNRSGKDREWIMASLHLRPGHSGGPMVNTGGKLIGINTVMRGPDVGVAIPIETVKHFLKTTIGSLDKAA